MPQDENARHNEGVDKPEENKPDRDRQGDMDPVQPGTQVGQPIRKGDQQVGNTIECVRQHFKERTTGDHIDERGGKSQQQQAEHGQTVMAYFFDLELFLRVNCPTLTKTRCCGLCDRIKQELLAGLPVVGQLTAFWTDEQMFVQFPLLSVAQVRFIEDPFFKLLVIHVAFFLLRGCLVLLSIDWPCADEPDAIDFLQHFL